MLSTAAPFLLAGAASADCLPGKTDLRGPWGNATFSVEMADTPETRATGLMHRKSLARTAGMLFVYEYPQRASFWMKNTLIPLDILFADRSGVVTHIHHNAVPHDLTPLPGGDKVYAVLEINGGLAQRYGISEGTQMRHEVFSGGPAIWAC